MTREAAMAATDHPQRTGPDIDGLEARTHSFLDLAALVAAVELGLPAALAQPRSAEELAPDLGIRTSRLVALLDALCWIGVLSELDGAYALEPAGATLLGTGPGSGLATLAYFRSTAAGWLELGASLRGGEPRRVVPWPPGVAATRYPHRDKAMILPELLADHLPLPTERPARAVDLGCGSGAVSEALLRRHPQLSVILVDRAPVVQQAAARLADQGLSDRVQAMAGDLLGPAPPLDADLVLLCNLLHSYADDGCQRLLARASSVLRPGGCLAVADLRVDRSGRHPRTAGDFSLYMALFAREGGAHAAKEILSWMQAAGLEQVHEAEAFPPWAGCQLLLGRRGTEGG